MSVASLSATKLTKLVPEAYRPALITPNDCDSSRSPRAAHSCLTF